DQPRPPRSELRDAGLDKLRAESIKRSETLINSRFQVTGDVSAAIWLHPVPEMQVVPVLSRIVEQSRLRRVLERRYNHFLQAFTLQPRSGGQFITLNHIGVVVLVMVVFQGFSR